MVKARSPYHAEQCIERRTGETARSGQSGTCEIADGKAQADPDVKTPGAFGPSRGGSDHQAAIFDT